MSRFLTKKEDGTYLEEIESMEVCKWRISDVCCNEKSEDLGDYPYPRETCYHAGVCPYFEKEDGVIKDELS